MSVQVNPALLAPGAAATAPAERAGKAGASTATTRGQVPAGEPGRSFADALKEASGEPLRFSKHALERVRRRDIPLDAQTLERLQEGVGRIAGKSVRDSLVLVDGTAFVVSVPNRTVITAVGNEHMREHVFTNIDSAVIA